MMFKPYTNRTNYRHGTDPKARQIDLYFTYFLPDFDRSMWLKSAGLDVDSYRIGSYVHVD